jgi:lipopolysaccharide/colanic/teichoic acid biosynthesis glycosyltransferase
MAKRTLDIIGSSLALLLGAPLLGAIAVLIWATSGRPILFCQERMGRGFVPFRLFKFRSMKMNTVGPSVTAAADPRVTAVGRVLRAWKLDELPQFWNVLKGDMSLVGPRPELRGYVELYRDRYSQILSVRPGITDPASIAFRNEEQLLARDPDPERLYRETVLPQKLALAERYVAAPSLLIDIRILLTTAWAVTRK